jgi:transposase
MFRKYMLFLNSCYPHPFILKSFKMPRKTVIQNHLSSAELKKMSKRVSDPVAAKQAQVIYLLSQGKTQKEVAVNTGYSAAWVHAIVQRYNEEGGVALKDRRQENPGRPYRLSSEVREEMRSLLQHPHPTEGLWTGPLLVEWVKARTQDESIDNKRGWEWLRQMECPYRLTRKRQKNKKKTAKKIDTPKVFA